MSTLQDLVSTLLEKREEYLYQKSLPDNAVAVSLADIDLTEAQNALDTYIDANTILKNIKLLFDIGYFQNYYV